MLMIVILEELTGRKSKAIISVQFLPFHLASSAAPRFTFLFFFVNWKVYLESSSIGTNKRLNKLWKRGKEDLTTT